MMGNLAAMVAHGLVSKTEGRQTPIQHSGLRSEGLAQEDGKGNDKSEKYL